MTARVKNPEFKSSGISISLRNDQIRTLRETGETPSSIMGALVDKHFKLTPPPQYLDIKPKTKPRKKTSKDIK